MHEMSVKAYNLTPLLGILDVICDPKHEAQVGGMVQVALKHYLGIVVLSQKKMLYHPKKATYK